MTAMLDAEHVFVESDDAAQVRFEAPHPHIRFVKIVDKNGVIHLIPWDHLDDAEKAIMTNKELYKDTIEGLRAFERGEGVSSDWLFDDDE
ncbi:MAG: hypothetical protein WBB00_07955 [Mycobacterium sp.]